MDKTESVKKMYEAFMKAKNDKKNHPPVEDAKQVDYTLANGTLIEKSV